MDANGQVLVQVENFIMSSPELLLGFIILLLLKTVAWRYSSAATEADSDFQPIASTSSPTCSNTFVSGSFFIAKIFR